MSIKQAIGLFILLALFLLVTTTGKFKNSDIPWGWPITPLIIAFLITLGNYLLWP